MCILIFVIMEIPHSIKPDYYSQDFENGMRYMVYIMRRKEKYGIKAMFANAWAILDYYRNNNVFIRVSIINKIKII